MVCHVMGPVSHSTRSEDILPSPSKLRLQRDWKPTVPPLSSACLQVNHADREKTSCWNNLKEKVEGNLEKKGRRGCLSAAKKLPFNTSKKKKKKKCILASFSC